MSAEPSVTGSGKDIGRVVIGIGGLVVHRAQAGYIATHALGSCLGVTIYDPQAQVGGMLHAQLPMSSSNPERAKHEPGIFVDLGIPALFRAAYQLGADKARLRVVVAGCASIGVAAANDVFAIGKRNLTIMRKLFWQNGVLVAAEDAGGNRPRNLFLDLADGSTAVESEGQRYTL